MMNPTRFKILLCGFRLTGPEASHGERRQRTQGAWLGSSRENQTHPLYHVTYSPDSPAPQGSQQVPNSSIHMVRYHTSLLCLGHTTAHEQHCTDLQETRWFLHPSEIPWYCYWKLSHLGKGGTNWLTLCHPYVRSNLDAKDGSWFVQMQIWPHQSWERLSSLSVKKGCLLSQLLLFSLLLKMVVKLININELICYHPCYIKTL